MKLAYRLRSDFSLTRATSGIHTTELRDATTQLSTIYGAQGVAVTINGPELVVEEVSASVAPAAAPSAQAHVLPPHPPAVSPAYDAHVSANANAQ
jgi:hypothetical protein